MKVKGLEQWKALEGRTVGFQFNYGWGDVGWVELDLVSVSRTYNEFDKPMVACLEQNGGGNLFYESDEVDVGVLND